jgi:predicted peptidase
VVAEARVLAEGQVDASAANFRAKGDQHRSYRFDAAGRDLPYRLVVPDDWDGTSELPLVMFLHGAGNDESSYLDQDGKLMVNLAQQHDMILVSPLGADSAYGSYLRLPAVFGKLDEADTLVQAKTDATERAQELSERDVINVLELVLAEYPVDRNNMFLMGHSMGSGGSWYLGGKYSFYWKAIAPLSGPFVQTMVYPWERMMSVPMFVTEGTDTPSLEGSRAVRDWLMEGAYPVEYEEVQADHGGMVPLVLPAVFDFFDRMQTQ